MRDIALREMGELDTDLESPEGTGIRIPLSVFKKVFLPYREQGLLPSDGGVLDQDPDVMDAIALGQYGVAWHKQNEKRREV